MSKDLHELFDASLKKNTTDSKISLSSDETEKFKKAFKDPEFRKLFEEYLDEMQNPANRLETEAYISQLENENKVPEGKELIRPKPGYVAKTKKTSVGGKGEDKVFINIVHSDKIKAPTRTSSDKGDAWSLPYSLGPPHMEKDKSGANAVAFDCCFHPDILSLSNNSRFRDIVVQTAIDGIVEYYKRAGQKVDVSKDFHVVKGVEYKDGDVPTMLIVSEAKDNWNEKKDDASKGSSVTKLSSKQNSLKTETSSSPTNNENKENKKLTQSSKDRANDSKKTSIRKGFLLNNDEAQPQAPSSSPLIREVSSTNSSANQSRTLPEVVKDVTPVVISGPLEPVYTVTERGALSLGDFEAMKDKVLSNRPAEIVYRVQLPLADKPSKIALDVAERNLSLSYLDVYALSVKLPYPVHDKKGTAKYEKATKSLVISLPVKLHEPTVPVTAISPFDNNAENDLTPSRTESSDSKVPSDAGRDNSAIPQKNAKDSHSRWISNNEMLASNESANNNKSLSETIKEEAAIAKMEYEKALAMKATSSPAAEPAPVPITKQASSNNTTSPSVNDSIISTDKRFIASVTFKGSNPGYVYRIGDEGLGYYVDWRQKPISAPIYLNAFPYEYRQTKVAIALLVNVSNIIAPSVCISYTESSVDIIFRAMKSSNSDMDSVKGYETYGLGFDISGKINVELCKHDVVTKNMVVILTKSADQALVWEDSNHKSSETKTDGNDGSILRKRTFKGDLDSCMKEVFPAAQNLDQDSQESLKLSDYRSLDKLHENSRSESAAKVPLKEAIRPESQTTDKIIHETLNAMKFSVGGLYDLD